MPYPRVAVRIYLQLYHFPPFLFLSKPQDIAKTPLFSTNLSINLILKLTFAPALIAAKVHCNGWVKFAASKSCF